MGTVGPVAAEGVNWVFHRHQKHSCLGDHKTGDRGQRYPFLTHLKSGGSAGPGLTCRNERLALAGR